MYIAVASPQTTTPPTVSTPRSHIASGWSRTARNTSAETPMTTAFEMVPMPGTSRSGIQSTITRKLTITRASPSVIGRCRARPECSTSHGA